MNDWTEGQWREWVAVFPCTEYQEEDAPSLEVYKSWVSDSVGHRMFLEWKFVHEFTDFGVDVVFRARLSGALRDGKGRRQWEAEKVRRVPASNPREEAMKEILVNLLLY